MNTHERSPLVVGFNTRLSLHPPIDSPGQITDLGASLWAIAGINRRAYCALPFSYESWDQAVLHSQIGMFMPRALEHGRLALHMGVYEGLMSQAVKSRYEESRNALLKLRDAAAPSFDRDYVGWRAYVQVRFPQCSGVLAGSDGYRYYCLELVEIKRFGGREVVFPKISSGCMQSMKEEDYAQYIEWLIKFDRVMMSPQAHGYAATALHNRPLVQQA